MIKIKFHNIPEEIYGYILDATAGLLTDQEITKYVESQPVNYTEDERTYDLQLPFKVIGDIKEYNDTLHITFKSNVCVEINDCEYERIEII